MRKQFTKNRWENSCMERDGRIVRWREMRK